jgi:phage shock protein PspC (stress-responsive transcriptional regulator)
MQKVVSINLNGNVYQLDESGYDALRQYLADAERVLESNPDRAEILADLEQAIADKCRPYLGPHKTVVTSGEIEHIIREMGPIEATKDESPRDGTAGGRSADATAGTRPKRLFRNPDGAIVAGVCSGLAAYLDVDITLVRIGFVILAIVTKGVGVIAYVALMFVVPEATTAEERAAIGGAPFNAKDVIDRAKQQYADGARQLRRQLRHQQRYWRRYGWRPGPPGTPTVVFAQPPWTAVALPVLALIHLALFLTMAAALVSLVNTGAVLNWRLPPTVPVWAGALMVFIGYQIVVSPIRAVQHWSWRWRTDGQSPVYAFWYSVSWLVGMAFVLWIASSHIPELREFVQRLPQLARDFAEAMRGLISPER